MYSGISLIVIISIIGVLLVGRPVGDGFEL